MKARLLSLLLAMGSAASPLEARAEPTEQALSYEAPAECPSQQAWVRKVMQRLSPNTPSPPARLATLRVRLEASGANEYHGTLSTNARQGRSVASGSCEEVAQALALLAALAIEDPSPAAPSDKRPSSAPVWASDAAGDTAADPSATSSASIGLPPEGGSATEAGEAKEPPLARWSVQAQVETQSVLFQRLPYLVGATLHWRGGLAETRWQPSVALSFLASGQQSWSAPDGLGASAAFSWVGGRLASCPYRWAATPWLALEGCGHADVGLLRARGLGLTDARQHRTWWLALGASLVSVVQLGPVSFSLQGGAIAPLSQPEFRFDPARTVLDVPPLGLSAGIGVGWRL